MPEKGQKYQEVELFDVPALFINERVAGEAVPGGIAPAMNYEGQIMIPVIRLP